MKFAGLYGLNVGLMITRWGFFLVGEQVPELRTEPIRISFHLMGGFVTALGLAVLASYFCAAKPAPRKWENPSARNQMALCKP